MDRGNDEDLLAPENLHEAVSHHRSSVQVVSRGSFPRGLVDEKLRAGQLPAGYQLPFFAPFCYSRRGTSPMAEKSRRLRNLVRQKDAGALTHCAALIAALRDNETASQILNGRALLIPVPPRVPIQAGEPPTPPEAVAQALHAANLGAAVWPALRRPRTLSKSSWASPASRPAFLDHYLSLEFVGLSPPIHQVVLVDDIITRGRAPLAAAAVLYQVAPGASISAFALLRSDACNPDIAALTDPVVGQICYLGGDAFRCP